MSSSLGPKPVDHHIAPPVWPRPANLSTTSDVSSSPSSDATPKSTTESVSKPISSESNSNEKKEEERRFLVIDTNAFIKGVRLDQLATDFYTVPEVLREVRDAFAKKNLEQVHFDIKTREPSTEAIKAVTEFSKKTGDYPRLSGPDLKVLALTYMLEVEVGVGLDALRKEPFKGVLAVPAPQTSVFQVKPVSLDVKENKEEEAAKNLKEEKKEETQIVEEKKEGKVEEKKEETHQHSESCNHSHTEESTVNPSTTEEKKKKKKKKKAMVVIAPVQQAEEEDEDDNDENWITPDNLEEVKKQHQGDIAKEFRKVGCITSDFAMQNVILQMGMGLLTVDGMVIKKVTNWVQKCFGCFQLCMNNEKKFCPKCGNATLFRVSIEVNEEGQVVVHDRPRRNIIRGTQYAVPLPQGGRNNKDLIFDEFAYQRALEAHSHKGSNHVAADAMGTPKMKNDGVVVGYGRKNPNVHKAKVGKKNRNPAQRV